MHSQKEIKADHEPECPVLGAFPPPPRDNLTHAHATTDGSAVEQSFCFSVHRTGRTGSREVRAADPTHRQPTRCLLPGALHRAIQRDNKESGLNKTHPLSAGQGGWITKGAVRLPLGTSGFTHCVVFVGGPSLWGEAGLGGGAGFRTPP